jgi:acetoin utilization deacetylase AcuC-like enzyme
MDPHEDSAIGGLDGITTDTLRARERWFFQWAALRQLPVAFVLAGGYVSAALTEDALVGLHRLTIEAAVDPMALEHQHSQKARRGNRS